MKVPADPEAIRLTDGVLRTRRSVRAYLPDPVPRPLLEDILDVAGTAPSNSNTRPGRVHVLAGGPRDTLGDALVAAFREDRLPPSPHFPDPLPEEAAQRQREFGARYYRTLGIDGSDGAARKRQTEKNFHFFGAPVGLVFTIDRRLTAHSWLDLGLLVQNVIVAATARGLGTCAQVSFARFHPIIARHLGFGADELTVCGMSLGYPRLDEPVNRLGMPRRAVQAFACFDHFEA